MVAFARPDRIGRRGGDPVRQRPFARPRTSQQTVYRVRFDQAGNVAAMDKTGVEKVARINPDGKRTPTLGRDRSFFEDLFGGIGTVGAAGGGGGGDPGGRDTP